MVIFNDRKSTNLTPRGAPVLTQTQSLTMFEVRNRLDSRYLEVARLHTCSYKVVHRLKLVYLGLMDIYDIIDRSCQNVASNVLAPLFQIFLENE